MKAPTRLALAAEFDAPEALRAAVRRLAAEGYSRLDAYTPYGDPELEEALAFPRTRLPWLVLVAALGGAAFAYLLQWWISVVAYPLNVGGRPLHSALAFIPITFETAILCGSLCGFVALWAASGLPAPWHPLFEIEGFERASVDRYWLGVGAEDPRWDAAATPALLEGLGALRVVRVEAEP